MTVFLYLSRVIPFEEARAALAEQVRQRYMHAGGSDVANNLKAIDDTISGLREVSYPASWADEPDQFPVEKTGVDFIDRIARPCLDLQGDRLPVSLFAPDGKLIDYINNENRYADLRMISPNDADRLQPLLQKRLYSVFSNLAASVKLPRVLG